MARPSKFPTSKSEFTDVDMLRDELRRLAPYRSELGKLHQRIEAKAAEEGPYAMGLGLSGGGIRSASVSLGIMQKLAESDLLRHVDYLSTVSGGGYIGSALTWWLRKRGEGGSRYGTGKHDFPFGTSDPDAPEPPREKGPLQYLRAQGNYLAPGNGITLWSGLAVVLRAIFINLMVWIPTTALVMLLLYLLGQTGILKGLPFLIRMVAPGVLETVADTVGSSETLEVNQTIPPLFLLALVLAIMLFALFLLGSLGHSLLSWTDTTEPPGQRRAGFAGAKGPRKEHDRSEATGQEGEWYSWILAGVTGLAGILILGFTIAWLSPIIEPLFGAWQETAAPAAGLLPWGAWFGAILWFAALVLTFACRSLSGAKPRQIATVLIGLLIVIAAAIGFTEWGRGWPLRFGMFMQLLFATAYVIYLYYFVGLLIRHFLRNQATGAGEATLATPTPSRLQYHARRVFEWFYGRSLVFGLALTALGMLPLVNSYIDFRLGGVWTAIGLGITAAGQLWGRAAGHGRFTSIVIIVGAALFAYGVMLIGYRLAMVFIFGDAMQRALIVSVMIAALIAGWFVNTNHIGLHRYYRDRLMEAFMPDDGQLKSDLNKMACEANEFTLASAWPGDQGNASGPYHLVNANLVLSNSDKRKYRLRAGDNFLLSPLYIGSSATDWHRTCDTDNRGLTLSSAMAVSGAAANPRGAAGGRGLTRNPAVSLAMSLLNVRLGYWIPNPRYRKEKRWLTIRPNHFWPGGAYALGAAWGYGYREDAKWLELADGGHFENLAIYELVRRRCGLIIVCDGGQDNASSYADLVTAVERVGEDFGAALRFNVEVKNEKGEFSPSGPAQLIAKHENIDYPKGAEFADKGYCIASIDYGERGTGGWPQSGIIIYLKSALILKLGIRAKGYRGAHPDFPNESTGDQFFDEEQFDAYREVGYRICSQMVEDLGLATLYDQGRPELSKLRDNDGFRMVGKNGARDSEREMQA